jgi:hypothetical protein
LRHGFTLNELPNALPGRCSVSLTRDERG